MHGQKGGADKEKAEKSFNYLSLRPVEILKSKHCWSVEAGEHIDQ